MFSIKLVIAVCFGLVGVFWGGFAWLFFKELGVVFVIQDESELVLCSE